MARAQDQKRWREQSGRKRVEVYLSEDTVTALDKLASECGASRAAVIASLIEAKPQPAQRNSYQFRRPQVDAETPYEWILIHDGAPLAGLKRHELGGWQGSYLKPTMLSRPCKRKTREAVAKELIEAPEIYR